MAKGSGTISGMSGAAKTKVQTPEAYNEEIGVDVQSIKEGLQSYSHIDRWNNSSAYDHGFNDRARELIGDLSRGDYGLATEIAKQIVNRPSFNNYGASLSEKQAYVLAKAAYDNKVLKSNYIIFDKTTRERAKETEARQREERHRRNERRAERDKAAASSRGLKQLEKGQKVPVGSKVYDKYGLEYEVTKRSGDIFHVKDKNGHITSLHKAKVYFK